MICGGPEPPALFFSRAPRHSRAMTPNLKHIQAFVAVADLGTFRRAAERLNTTQPNISGRIAQLEEQLGFRLMERDAGSVRLTPRGQSLLAPARAILAAMEEAKKAGAGATTYKGKLIDIASMRQAEVIVRQAELIAGQ